ncbi:hypothetical protein J437_LFUL001314 [Ladona fulva]|uniref:VPS9 domain-containing protein n=1 Tax=Ladona fulva TaxID=123851 RepID=A0A8K0NXC7_LADFU|nr:hypothetical protein J437_LFUL001314 [Ladona fulva]
MSEGNLRQQAVKSLMTAIDLENDNQDLEAYLKYLEGLSLVVTALQEDATNGEEWLFTDKVRRSFVNFAKESVDRIILLLKKQDRTSEKKQDALPKTVLNSPDSVTPPIKTDECNSSNFYNEQKRIKGEEIGSSHLNTSIITDYSFTSDYAEEVNDVPLSPLETVRIENTQLSKKYAHRILNAPVSQKPQLRLELERRIAENVAIAENKQLLWEAEREKAAQHYQHLARQKCKLPQKTDGDNKNIEVELQDVTYSCYMFEWENKLRTIDGSLEALKLDTVDKEVLRHAVKKSMDLGVRALMGSIRRHPLGSFMVKKQQLVYNEISSILSSNQALETPEVEMNMDCSAKENKGPLLLFYQIADKMKKDLEYLETILLSLYAPLNTDEGQLLLSKTLQKIYFPALTPSIKAMLRLCVNSQKPGSKVDQQMQCKTLSSESSLEDNEMASLSSVQNASEMEARFRLMSLQSLPSPYEKLDCLTEVMRSLCSWKFDRSKAEAKEDLQPIGADDLLSRLVSVINGGATGEGSLSHLLKMEAIFLETFLPDNMVLGEAGYCVTVLCSALSL